MLRCEPVKEMLGEEEKVLEAEAEAEVETRWGGRKGREIRSGEKKEQNREAERCRIVFS